MILCLKFYLKSRAVALAYPSSHCTTTGTVLRVLDYTQTSKHTGHTWFLPAQPLLFLKAGITVRALFLGAVIFDPSMRNRNPCSLKPLGLSTFYSSIPLCWNSSFSNVLSLLLPLLSSSKQVEFAVGRKQSILWFVVRGIQTLPAQASLGIP